MKNTTKYLYDIEPEELEDMMYLDALEYMVKSATTLMAKLVKKSKDMFYGSEEHEKIYTRYCEVCRAKKHNEDLLEQRNKDV